MIEQKFIDRVAEEAAARPGQVVAAIGLLDKGATVPFIARYRKDVTGNLNETALELIEQRNAYFIALTNRRDAILENIAKQERLTEELRSRITSCMDHASLEDLYLPFKKQRRTRASDARDKGLEPLADIIWAQAATDQSLESHAATYVNPDQKVSSPEEALEGARYILAERIANDTGGRRWLREHMLEEGIVKSVATKNAEQQKTKFEAYYSFSEPLKKIPSHRFLAVLRGVRLGFLRMDVAIDDEAAMAHIAEMYISDPACVWADEIRSIACDAYQRLLRPAIENEVVGIARQQADDEAITVFRENASNLLLSPPAGRIAVIGVDPGLRSGCKLAVVDDTGAFKESATIFPGPPDNDFANAEKTLNAMFERYELRAIAIGNGTGSREVAKFIGDVLKRRNNSDVFSVFVNESGASVYSASKVARQEFPDLDVTIRGAISIARRLQDPLAELVKIEPRSIGVGQYQHDVNQRRLKEGLYRTVESCVNAVGVDLNTASVELLRYVSGIQMGTAQNIVEFRSQAGGFSTRQQLVEVSGIGEKTFEQSAGFLRIRGGTNPLDATSIHPEAYPVVEQIAKDLAVEIDALIKNPELLEKAAFNKYQTEIIGTHTLTDIRAELLKPGRDPRKEFRVPKFIEGVNSLDDLEEGMDVEGVVTNVTDFGAFIDVGVHQDGLVHLSEMANRYVRDPREIVKVGQIVKARVVKIDKELSRISLSMKALAPPPQRHRAPGSTVSDQPESRTASPDRSDGEAGPRRPSRDERPSRDRGAAQKSKPRKPQRKPARPQQRSGAGAKPSAEKEQFNTVLADQLAALKDRFNS